MTVGIYLHIPFCENICDYCDFYSVIADGHDQDRYVQAVQQELIDRSFTSDIVDTIYFGGGNPGLLTPKQILQLIQTIRDHYPLAKELEVTLESNPENSSEEKLLAYSMAGINRISFGVQTYDQRLLDVLGRRRISDPQAIICAAVKTFPQVSLDFILGIPGQTIESLREDLNRIPKEVGHLSIYDLTIYQNTRLANRINHGTLQLNSEAVGEALENVLHERLPQLGLCQYEVSNFAKNGQQSKHNLHYWHADDYLGVGAGASSTWEGQRITNSALGPYLSGKRTADIESLSMATQKLEWAMMNLRLTEGFLRESYIVKFGKDIVDDFAKAFETMAEHFIVSKDQIALTKRGRQLHHTVLTEFVP